MSERKQFIKNQNVEQLKSLIKTNNVITVKNTNMRNFIFCLIAILFLGTGVYGQSIGEQHNILVRDVMKEANFSGSESQEYKRNVVIRIIKEKFGMNQYEVIDLASKFNDPYLILSTVEKDYSKKLISEVRKDVNFLLTNPTPKQVNSYFDDRMKNSILDKAELVIYLDLVSIAKSSTTLWNSSEGIDYANILVQNSTLKNEPGAIAAACDMTGALFGSLGGPIFALASAGTASVCSLLNSLK
ncbi:MAG: hypothetical protein Q4G27_02155 [Flavobacteriaceae bacterium]|nr:hypothetical protein [Flavobacteriaceae bacterium]